MGIGHLIDLSTIKTKLPQLLWVCVALALTGIISCDLFDLKIHSEVALHEERDSTGSLDITESNLHL